jgi:hypothetical protein
METLSEDGADMKKFPIKSAVAAAAFAALLFQGGPAALSQSCVQYTGSFSETFATVANIDVPDSSVDYWCTHASSPSDIATLNKVGGNFTVQNPANTPSWLNTLTANDFDGDGWPDFVGTSSSYSNCLVFVKNMGGQGQVGTFQITLWIDGSRGDASGWPVAGVGGAALDTEGHCSITSGDYDGDGDIDFLYVCSSTASGFPIKRIWLYRNTLITNGANTGTVGFQQVDLTSALSAGIGGIAWSATSMISADIDKDGDIDVLIGNKDGNVFKLTNTGNKLINSQTFYLEPTPVISTGWGGRGVNTVSVADFRGAGVLDLIIGSVSNNVLNHYANDGSGHFTLFQAITYNGAATVSLSADFDQNGTQDLIIGTDAWNYPANNGSNTGYGGKVIYLRNTGGGAFVQNMIFDGSRATPVVYDFDMGAVFDFNHDGVLDFVIADGNDSRYYYVFKNGLANVYNTLGVAESTDLTPTLGDQDYAITQARFSGLTQRILGGSDSGLDVSYYLSNDDGRTWMYYAEFKGGAIANAGAQSWFSFTTYGSKLRWMAVLSAPVDSIPNYDNASYETPVLDTISLDYIYVDRREYSRTSAAAEVIVSGQRKELIISATFMFPGLEGHLRAYDVTGITMQSSTNSTIQTITSPNLGSSTGRTVAQGGSILWDAADLLDARTSDSRTIYAGYRAYSGAALQRLAFSTANTSTLAPLLLDVDGDNAGLINFVRGQGRDSKLGDIQHSNPVIVGPPSGSVSAMGSGYDTFAAANAGRRKVIFVGANDGMLHCFDATDGTELWGYIPYNLVPMLKNMSKKDSRTGVRYFSPASYVDGTPSVGDAYISGVWKTVLVCGQGKGKGSSVGGGLNYYFALDVTDPLNPQPMWELTATTMGETWSVPAFGQVNQSGTNRWVVFMGSGYDNGNNSSVHIGNYFYVVRLDTGAVIRSVSVSNVNTSSTLRPKPFPDIYVTIPGSPTAVNSDTDVMTEYVYVGDLDGRFYRMDVTNTSTSYWNLTAIYTDNDNYPIITKPAVFADPLTGGMPLHIYFGTGGDDSAPIDRYYAFIAMTDTGSSAAVEWYMGDAAELNLSSSLRVGGFGVGEKVWADPVISDNIVYFSTLTGSIENVNPCVNLLNIGRLYARFVRSVAGSVVGATALKTTGGVATESYQLASKARRAVTIGGQQRVPGTNKREVYVQEYDSTVERLEQPIGSLLKILSWREIYRIYK